MTDKNPAPSKVAQEEAAFDGHLTSLAAAAAWSLNSFRSYHGTTQGCVYIVDAAITDPRCKASISAILEMVKIAPFSEASVAEVVEALEWVDAHYYDRGRVPSRSHTPEKVREALEHFRAKA